MSKINTVMKEGKVTSAPSSVKYDNSNMMGHKGGGKAPINTVMEQKLPMKKVG